MSILINSIRKKNYTMKNFYPEKPILPFVKTSTKMANVISYLQQANADKEVKRMAYIMFRNESGNGSSGINNNYCGFQADSGRWSPIYDSVITGVVDRKENKTGKERLFIAFSGLGPCLDMLLERVKGRGLYIGGKCHVIWKDHIVSDSNELARAYQKEWVMGSAKAEPSPSDMSNFLSMYKQSVNLFK